MSSQLKRSNTTLLLIIFFNFVFKTTQLAKLHSLPYKTIHWRGINIGNWRFFRKFANIKIANINYHMETPTKPLLKMKKLEKKDVIAQIANIKPAKCFSQTNLQNIILANKYSCTIS